MWAAHFLFHLLTGLDSAVPVVQRGLADIGYGLPGSFGWTGGGMSMDLLGPELLLLDVGLLMSLYIGWRIASRSAARLRTTFALAAPWAIVAVVLYVSGVWTFLQPMQMRGMMMHGPAQVAIVER
jgi:hypothetical protein